MKSFTTGLLGVTLALALLTGCGASGGGADGEIQTTDFDVIGMQSVNDSDLVFTVTTDFGNDDHKMKVDDSFTVEWFKTLYQYHDRLTLRADYDGDYNLVDYTILDKSTGEDLGRLDAEGLYQAFDTRAKYENVEMEYTGDISLSQLEEDVLYIYTLPSDPVTGDYPTPVIVNDTGKNVEVYGEDLDYGMIENQHFFNKNLGEGVTNLDFSTFCDTFMLHYVSFSDSEVMEKLPKEEVILLSQCERGQSIPFDFQYCFYNDTDEDLTLVSDEDGSATVIHSGEAYGFNWMGLGYTLK